MKTLLIYATNSGSTLEVSNTISGEFTQKGQEITLKDARDINPDEIGNYDFIIMGSPTYDEGNMHDLFVTLSQKLDGKTFPGKKFAVFGLGDTSYPHFCGAADHLAEVVKKVGGTLVGEPLKINNYYFNMQDEQPKITGFAQKILSSL